MQNSMYNPTSGLLPEKLAVYVALLIEEEKWDMAELVTEVLIAVNHRYNWQDVSQNMKDHLMAVFSSLK